MSIPCPECDTYHDSPNVYCNDCCRDLRHMLDSGQPEIMTVVTEFISDALAIASISSGQ